MLQALKIAEENHLNSILYNTIGNHRHFYYSEMGDHHLAKDYYLKSIASAAEKQVENANVGSYYVLLGSAIKI